MSNPHLPDPQSDNPVEEADLDVARQLVPASDHPIIRALGSVSDLTDQEPLYAATISFAAVGLLFRDLDTVRAGTEMLAAHLVATAARGVVKKMVDRTRPDAAARRGGYERGPGRHYESDFNSFPSGHTAGALAVALTASRHYPSATGPVLGLAAAAGAAQIIRSKHFITDVVAGAALGWAGAALIGLLVNRAEKV